MSLHQMYIWSALYPWHTSALTKKNIKITAMEKNWYEIKINPEGKKIILIDNDNWIPSTLDNDHS